MKLVLVESPAKAKTIQKYLGSDYKVMATVGHIIDLPKNKISVDIKNDFKPTFQVMPDKKDIAKKIKDLSKQAEEVIIMTDPDREGSGMAANILDQLISNKSKVKRASTNSITKSSVQEAIKKAGSIDNNAVDSYLARRILDRICGYRASFPVKQATGGPSVGRVQSAGLRIIAEREEEIQNFKPIIYWPIEAILKTDKNEKFGAKITKPKPLKISSKEEAEKIIDTFKKSDIKVSKYDKKEVKSNPYPPFITSTMQQTASTVLGFSPKRTMDVAQSLYQKSAITYHRTDSFNIIPDFVNTIRDHIKSNFDSKYLPKTTNAYKSKAKHSQEGHEAIRPTDLSVKEYLSGSDDEKKLYELIWRRTVSSQMTPANFERISAEFSAGKFVLGANGSRRLFDGYQKVWVYSFSKDQYIPSLKVGDLVDIEKIWTEKKETQPPPRYTEASLGKELEKKEIGRPATYASIYETLKNRGYMEIKKKSIYATLLGMKVSKFLVENHFCFVDYDFTKSMEEDLDLIAENKKDKLETLKEFWETLKSDLETAKKVKKDKEKTNYPCPKCKKKGIDSILLLKHSKYGAFFSCENYSNKENKCDYKANVGEDGSPVEKVKKEVVYSEYKCPKCNKKMIEREGPYGKFYGCQNFTKGCYGMRNSDGEEVINKKKKWKKKKKKKKKSQKE